VSVPVRIRGVGMFDFLHGQTGVAPNGIELHPVLDIVFNPSSTTFSISGNAGTTGATVTTGSASATSDASGNYTISGLASGTYTVTPSKSGCTFTPASQSVTISSSNVTGKNFTAACGTGDTLLTSGVTLTGQSVALNAWKYYYVDVASGTTSLTFATTSATADVDIYTQSGGFKPTSSSYVCRPYTSSGNETCTATNPAVGRWYLGVYGYAAGSFSVTATVVTSTPTYSIAGSAGTAGATLTTGTATATSDASNNYAISGLAAGTYIVTPSKTGCTFSPASLSVTLGPNATGENFTATCSGEVTLFSDGFEGTGWSFAQVSGTAGFWTLGASGTHPAQGPHGGSKLADFNSYTSASGSETRIYRSTGFTAASSYTSVSLKFWMYHDPGYSTDDDRVQVQVSTNGTTWTNVGAPVSRYSATAGWTQATVDLSAYKGQTVQLAFVGISAFGNDIYLDDVTVTGQ
jgi:Bacterial pre-peptidase C-terminal domain